MRKAKATPISPACPKCEGTMILRVSKYGKFWGCGQFPNCRGTRPYEEVEEQTPTASIEEPAWKKAAREKVQAAAPELAIADSIAPIVKVPGSPEQEAIWASMLNDTSHVVVNALAGTGKTFSMVQAILRLPKTTKIAFVAFNKHIATEAQGKLRASGCSNVLCCTYHSLGYRILRQSFPNAQVSDSKLDDIMETMSPPFSISPWDWRQISNLVGKLVGLAKNYLLDPYAVNFQEQMEEIADHHAIDLNGVGRNALEYVPRVMEECKRRASYVIDYDDMIWLPLVMNLPVGETFDIFIIDEMQDTNKAQQELAVRACGKGRIIGVGDRFQAIYGFRGADVTAIPSMISRLSGMERGVKEFPLTVTRRCSKSHVQLAQALVPEIRAMEDAPEGVIIVSSPSQAIAMMVPGDMVLCRVNKELIPAAYQLIARGIKPVIRGRDIGKGLLELISRFEKRAFSLPEMVVALNEYRFHEEDHLAPLGNKAAGRLGALHDKCDCLSEMMHMASSIADLKTRIESLFSDFEADGQPRNAVIMGTVHRTKGLEAERVFVLAPELIPHPMARQTWEQVQERNLAYVAVTRSKYTKDAPGTIVFCGVVPPIYQYKPVEEPK